MSKKLFNDLTLAKSRFLNVHLVHLRTKVKASILRPMRKRVTSYDQLGNSTRSRTSRRSNADVQERTSEVRPFVLKNRALREWYFSIEF